MRPTRLARTHHVVAETRNGEARGPGPIVAVNTQHHLLVHTKKKLGHMFVKMPELAWQARGSDMQGTRQVQKRVGRMWRPRI